MRMRPPVGWAGMRLCARLQQLCDSVPWPGAAALNALGWIRLAGEGGGVVQAFEQLFMQYSVDECAPCSTLHLRLPLRAEGC